MSALSLLFRVTFATTVCLMLQTVAAAQSVSLVESVQKVNGIPTFVFDGEDLLAVTARFHLDNPLEDEQVFWKKVRWFDGNGNLVLNSTTIDYVIVNAYEDVDIIVSRGIENVPLDRRRFGDCGLCVDRTVAKDGKNAQDINGCLWYITCEECLRADPTRSREVDKIRSALW